MCNPPEKEICRRIIRIRVEVFGPRGKASFARQLGISPTTYQSYERDRIPPADVLVRIADIAEVDLRWLLTGSNSADDIAGGIGVAGAVTHPVIQRAAVLLGRHPKAASALAAFIDILDKTMEFPSGDNQAGLGGEATEAPQTGQPALTGGANPEAQEALKPPAPRGDPIQFGIDGAKKSPSRPRPGSVRGLTGRSTIKDMAQPELPSPELQWSGNREAEWIPILGRSAAGVPHFWSDEDDTVGLATLGDLIARHSGQSRSRVREATVLTERSAGEDVVQMITLTADEGDVVEFISAGSIKARYPDAFAVRIDGESMSPDIRHGDVVILSPSAPAVDARVAVVQLARQIGVTCKLFRRDGGSIHLVPINEQYQPQDYPADDIVWAFRVVACVRPAER